MSLPSVRQASAQEDERWGVPERTECQNRMPIECQNYEKKSVRPGRGESNEPILIHIF